MNKEFVAKFSFILSIPAILGAFLVQIKDIGTALNVLLLLPSLIACGLLTYQNHYKELDKGYYYIDFIVLLQAFMYLCRIKNPEQLSKVNPGELGRLLGIDRIPEARCLRGKIC